MTHALPKTAEALLIAGLVAAVGCVSEAAAQAVPVAIETQEPAAVSLDQAQSPWKLELMPYLWIPAQSGTVAINGMPADIDLEIGETFETITDNFNFAVALHAELARDRLTFFADAMYLSLESNDIPTESGEADVRQDQGIFELGAAYTLVGADDVPPGPGVTLEPLGGVRIRTLSLDIDSSTRDSFSGTQTWADGFIGARAHLTLNDHVAFRLRGDIGAGGSDFTWSALAGIDVRLAQRIVLQAGYRALDADYSDGHGAERFEYDVLLHGPYAALRITF